MTGWVLGILLGVLVYFVVLTFCFVTSKDKSFISFVPDFGPDQILHDETHPCSVLLKYVRQDDLKKGSVVKIMTYNFPKAEWGSNLELFGWVTKQLENGVKVKVVGGLEIEAEEEVRELKKRGMLVTNINDPPISHYFLISSPKTLWFEKHHEKDDTAYDCYFTKNPHPETWTKVNKIFDDFFGPQNN